MVVYVTITNRGEVAVWADGARARAYAAEIGARVLECDVQA